MHTVVALVQNLRNLSLPSILLGTASCLENLGEYACFSIFLTGVQGFQTCAGYPPLFFNMGSELRLVCQALYTLSHLPAYPKALF